MGVYRLVKEHRSGITRIFQAFGEKPGETFSLPFLFDSRADAFNLLEFFESSGGALRPFWAPAPSAPFKAISITGSGAIVTVQTLLAETEDLTVEYLWSLNRNTQVHDVHKVNQITVLGGGQVAFTLNDVIPNENLEEWLFTTAHLCRFERDELQERWLTDTVLNTSLVAKELVNEKDVPITLVSIIGEGDGLAWAPECYHDLCPTGIRCGQTSGGCCICGTQVYFTKQCFKGECCPEVGCGIRCIITDSCAVTMNYASCIGDVARWVDPLNANNWVELDTFNLLWTYAVEDCCTGDLIDQCDDVTPGEPEACCIERGPGNCQGRPGEIETLSCAEYRKDIICTAYDLSGLCHYETAIRIICLDCEGGNDACA